MRPLRVPVLHGPPMHSSGVLGLPVSSVLFLYKGPGSIEEGSHHEELRTP